MTKMIMLGLLIHRLHIFLRVLCASAVNLYLHVAVFRYSILGTACQYSGYVANSNLPDSVFLLFCFPSLNRDKFKRRLTTMPTCIDHMAQSHTYFLGSFR